MMSSNVGIWNPLNIDKLSNFEAPTGSRCLFGLSLCSSMVEDLSKTLLRREVLEVGYHPARVPAFSNMLNGSLHMAMYRPSSQFKRSIGSSEVKTHNFSF